jgi:hypothetical protein
MSGIRPYVLEAKYELVKALRLPAFAIPRSRSRSSSTCCSG